MGRLKRRGSTLVLVLGLVATACTGSGESTTTDGAVDTTQAATSSTTAPATDSTAATTGGTIVIGTTFPVTSMDPADSQDLFGFELIRNYGEGLVKFTPGTADIIPGVAEALPEPNEDGTQYTVRLREGVTFGDGLELTAQMYVDQFNRAAELDAPAAGAYVTPFVESVEATDDRTIVFTLTGSYGFFPSVMTLPIYVPSHPDIFQEGELNPLPEPPIYGTGPWIVTGFTANEQVVLEQNPYYHGDVPPTERVIIREFADPQTMALALENDEIDVAWRSLDYEQVEQLEGAEGVTVAPTEGGRLLYYIVNHQLPPLDDPDVARGLAAAIDRDDIVDRVFGGRVDPLYSQIPPGILGSKDSFDEVYGSPDLELARQFLTKAGYSEDNPVQLVVGYPGARYGDLSVDAQSVIKEQLEATGMVQVELQSAEAGAYFDNLFGGEAYNLGFLGFEFDFPDPDNHVSLFVVDSGLGTFVTDPENNPRVDGAQELLDLLAAGATETDQDARVPIYEDLQDLWADVVVTLPLWNATGVLAYREGVSGNPDFPAAEALNVGATSILEYATLSLSD